MIIYILWALFAISFSVGIFALFAANIIPLIISGAIGVLILLYYLIKQAVKDAIKEMDNKERKKS